MSKKNVNDCCNKECVCVCVWTLLGVFSEGWTNLESSFFNSLMTPAGSCWEQKQGAAVSW